VPEHPARTCRAPTWPTAAGTGRRSTTARPTDNAGIRTVGRITSSRNEDFTVVRQTRPIQSSSKRRPARRRSEITFPFDVKSQPDANLPVRRGQGRRELRRVRQHGQQEPGQLAGPTPLQRSCKVFKNIGSNNKLTWTVSGTETLAAPDSCRGPLRKQPGDQGRQLLDQVEHGALPGVVVVRGAEGTGRRTSARPTRATRAWTAVNATRDKDSRSSEPSTSLGANDRPGLRRQDLSWRELCQ